MTWFDEAKSMARRGYGWEDVMVSLKLSRDHEFAVKVIVLKIPHLRGVVEPPATSAGPDPGGSTDTREDVG